jgi:predicted  nucleic acid-binding Zn-ribbon protein
MTQAWKDLTQRVSRNENDIESIYDLLSEIERKVDGHTATLAEHSTILNEHSTILNEHSATLASHGGKLDEILELLRRR